MAKIHNNILDRIGNTPLVRLSNYCDSMHIGKNIYAKMEGDNPGGSIKVRAALYSIEKGERQGKLGEHNTLVIEAANLNTAIGLAVVCAAKRYKLVVVMADVEGDERYSLLHAYGVQVVLTSKGQGIAGAKRKADELCHKNPRAFRPRLFYNSASSAAYKAVANEIWRDTGGAVDIVVVGVGSGATITGIAEALKRKKKSVQIVAVEAEEGQMLLSNKIPVPHGIRGISTGEMPPLVNVNLIDEVYPVSSASAYGACVGIASNDGILAGISSGAIVYAATQLARMPGNQEKFIVVVLPDTGERYLNTGLFDYSDSYIVIE